MRRSRAVTENALVREPRLSFAQVYDEHVETVYRYVHCRCRDHSLAEDVTQDTFTAAIRHTEDPSTITISWLITVARNRLLDILRRQTRYHEKLQLLAGDPCRSNEVEITERLRVELALGVLPMHYRLVLTLHYINGMTVRAIADELNQSLKSVEGLITRARRELTSVLEEAEPQSAEGDES